LIVKPLKKKKMSAFLIELPYVLVPFAMTVISSRANSFVREYSYAITGVILFLYPLTILLASSILNILSPTPWIAEHYWLCFFANTFFFLPLAFLLHLIFNEILLKNEDGEWTEIE
jgi:hypothetical protein